MILWAGKHKGLDTRKATLGQLREITRDCQDPHWHDVMEEILERERRHYARRIIRPAPGRY